MGERLKFKAVGVTPQQQRDGRTVVEATAEGVTYRIIGTPIQYGSPRRTFRAFRVIEQPGKTGLFPAQYVGEHRTRASAIQQCEADLDDVLRDRNGRPVPERDRQITTDPATTDDTQELLDRVIRRAQYLALQAVVTEVDRWLAPADRRDYVGSLVNDAARALGTAEPYRVAP